MAGEKPEEFGAIPTGDLPEVEELIVSVDGTDMARQERPQAKLDPEREHIRREMAYFSIPLDERRLLPHIYASRRKPPELPERDDFPPAAC